MRTLVALLLAALTCAAAAQAISEGSLTNIRALKVGAPRKWAIVIGASDYKELGPLKYARNDAEEFAKALIDDFTFKPNDVTLLLDEQTTAKNITSNLDRLFKNPRLDRGDLFIFYFAGHGIGTKKGDYLCPTDASKGNVEQVSLPVREVMNRIVATGMRNVLIIADACRSGEQNPFGQELRELGRKTNLAVLLGCAPGKRSYEYPKLKHGAFTYFLLQAMKDEALRGPTGGLWASGISNTVQQKVFAFTEKDYGKYAQQPAGWNDKRQDVMLGQFEPRTGIGRMAISQALEMFKSKGEDALPLALFGYATFLNSEQMPHLALEYLQAVDSLGKATPRMRFSLASTLAALGRDQEAERQYEQLLTLRPDDYWRLSAITVFPGDRFSAAEKLTAAMRVWRITHDPGDAVFASYLADAVDPNTAVSAVKELAAYYPKAGRTGLFFASEASRLAGDKAKARQLYWQSLDADGPRDTIHQTLLRLIELELPNPGDEVLLKIHSRGIQDDPESLSFWIEQEAERLKAKGDVAGMMKMIRLGLRGVPSPQEVFRLVTTAGTHAPELQDDLKRHVDRHPLSWQIDAAKWLVDHIADITPQFTLEKDLLSKVDDPIQFRVELFSAIDTALEDKELTGTESLLYNTKFFISLNQFNDKLGPDENLWNRMQRWAENSRRTQQISSLARAKLYPAILAKKGSSDLLTVAMRIAMNAGDDDSVEKLWRFAEKGGAMKTELAWQYTVYRLLRGDTKTAEGLLPKLPKPTTFVGEKAPQVVRAYLDLLSGASPEAILKVLEANEPTGFQDEYVWTMAQARCGRDGEAAQFFLNRALADDEYDLYSTGAGLQFAWKNLVSKGDKDNAFAIAEVAARFFGNPLFSEISFLPDSKDSDFSGSVTYDADSLSLEDEPRSESGKLTVAYDGKGNVSLTMEGLAAKGRIDRFGNFRAEGTWHGKPISLSAKLAPPAVYASHPDKIRDHIEGITADFHQVLFELTYAPK